MDLVQVVLGGEHKECYTKGCSVQWVPWWTFLSAKLSIVLRVPILSLNKNVLLFFFFSERERDTLTIPLPAPSSCSGHASCLEGGKARATTYSERQCADSFKWQAFFWCLCLEVIAYSPCTSLPSPSRSRSEDSNSGTVTYSETHQKTATLW